MEVVDRVRNGMGMSIADRGRLVGVDEAAERLGISTRTVRRLVQQRRIRHLRFGRLIKLSVWDVDSFLTQCTVEPVEQPSNRTDDYSGNEWSQQSDDSIEATS
jgi:excisionase family DNA binding protein